METWSVVNVNEAEGRLKDKGMAQMGLVVILEGWCAVVV